jgi:hypothetical protein
MIAALGGAMDAPVKGFILVFHAGPVGIAALRIRCSLGFSRV